MEISSAIDNYLDESCTIQKQEMSSGYSVGFVWTNVNTRVPCLLQPLSGGRQTTLLGKFPTASHRLFMRASYHVEQNYKIIHSGKTYNVILVNQYGTHHLEVTLEEVMP